MDKIELIKTANSFDFSLLILQKNLGIQIQYIAGPFVYFIIFMHSLVQAFKELGLSVLLYFIHEIQGQRNSRNFEDKHFPSFFAQNSTEQLNFMAEGYKGNIKGPEAGLEDITSLLEILMCLNKSLRKILNQLIFRVLKLLQKCFLIITRKVLSASINFKHFTQTLLTLIIHNLIKSLKFSYTIISFILFIKNKSIDIIILAIFLFMSKFHLEPLKTPEVPKDFHLKLRKRFIDALREQDSHKQNFLRSACLFKGIPTIHRNYDDIDQVVDQESTFWYLFGVKEADCYALIENESGKTTIFVPRMPESLKMWMTIKPKQDFIKGSEADQVVYSDQLQDYVKELNIKKIYLYYGVDSDSGIEVTLPESKYWNFAPSIDKATLWILISNLRAIKTEDEINILRYVCRTSTQAHISALKSTRAGLVQAQLQGVFQFEHTSKTGSRKTGFHGICSSGQDCATLHYIDNDKVYLPGDLALHDMGGKWYGYCADQAITFPVSGKFTEKQKQIYNAVYEAQREVLKVLKPGVKWDDMHLLAQKVILEHLIEIGLVNKYPMEELVDKRVGAVFFPHGLGHFLGLKTHDLGGYTKGPERSKQAGLCKLRTRRVMEENMVITVQPGCYFIDFIIKNALQGQNAIYFNAQKIKEYEHVGGVRLEDDVLITKQGNQVLSNLPRHWEELEKLLAE